MLSSQLSGELGLAVLEIRVIIILDDAATASYAFRIEKAQKSKCFQRILRKVCTRNCKKKKNTENTSNSGA
jgi:hypothetical protein